MLFRYTVLLATLLLGANEVFGQNNDDLILDSDNVTTASLEDGLDDADDGIVASLTDNANFINFCEGQTITNGEQNSAGSCNPIVMGEIPSSNQMVSTIITSPEPGEVIQENTDFTIVLSVSNLVSGQFTNPSNTYYSAPQQLQNGNILGHVHVVIQDLGGSFTPGNPPDASQFEFFLGINEAGNGPVTVDVEGGLAAGFYRACTMSAAANHQPVIMPVAQRGSQDDCTKFRVGGDNDVVDDDLDDDDIVDDDDIEDDNDAVDDDDDDSRGNRSRGNRGRGNRLRWKWIR